MQPTGIQSRFVAALVAGTALCIGNATHATVTISGAATKNIACSAGVCTPTKPTAVLNVSELQNLLASSDVTVTTHGARASDIQVSAPTAWTSSHRLTLDAYHSVIIRKPISITGEGGLTITDNDGGTGGVFSIRPTGSVTFWSLSSSFVVNGNSYVLVNDIATLASDIQSNPSGFYALAAKYNASADGMYSSTPIPLFSGTLDGLGNVINHFSLTNPVRATGVGLIGTSSGTVVHMRLRNVAVRHHKGTAIGGLAGANNGLFFEDSVSGIVNGVSGDSVGGLAGANGGTISNSSATASVKGLQKSYVGGLVGFNDGEVEDSYATGAVTGIGVYVGGLTGDTDGNPFIATIVNCYATGNVAAGSSAEAGGLIGAIEGGFSIATSYSTGSAAAGSGSLVGGFFGSGTGSGSFAHNYWDTTTSGTNNGFGGGGTDPNITGLTTAQFQSSLPAGFDPAIWAEDPSINNGLPYLIANPPK